jgi:hypothetical protein
MPSASARWKAERIEKRLKSINSGLFSPLPSTRNTSASVCTERARSSAAERALTHDNMIGHMRNRCSHRCSSVERYLGPGGEGGRGVGELASRRSKERWTAAERNTVRWVCGEKRSVAEQSSERMGRTSPTLPKHMALSALGAGRSRESLNISENGVLNSVR